MSISIFEIIGPSIVGPSSSHTAGMARIGLVVNQIIKDIDEINSVELLFNENIKNTFKGHKSDVAMIGGILGIKEYDNKIKNSKKIAKKKGLNFKISVYSDSSKSPNTVIIKIKNSNKCFEIHGESVGGGSIKILNIDNVKLTLTGLEYNYIFWGNYSLQNKIKDVLNQNNINEDEIIRFDYGCENNNCIYCISINKKLPANLYNKILNINGINLGREITPVLPYGVTKQKKPIFKTFEGLLNLSMESNKKLSQVVIDYEKNRTGFNETKIINQMESYLEIMIDSANKGLSGKTSLLGGIIDDHNGKKMKEAINKKLTISGGIIPEAIAKAIAILEVNGSMGSVVASPTAGSCGVVPGCFLALKEKESLSNDDLINGLFVAAGIGIAMDYAGVSFSGAEGGCQGEIGVSSALAAAGLVEMAGGSPKQVGNAVSFAIKNILGLICDTIAGPVEVPCIRRNSIGVANAFAAADMALSGLTSAIPTDETFYALINTQKLLPKELKGTTKGGLACTPTAIKIRNEIQNKGE